VAISLTLRAVGEPASTHERGDRLGRGPSRRVALAGDEVADDRVDGVGVRGTGRLLGRAELVDELGRGPPQIGLFELAAEVGGGAPTLVVRARDPVSVASFPPLGDDEEGSQGVVDREDMEPSELGREGSGCDRDASAIGQLEMEGLG
jgi:hypothetical protein